MKRTAARMATALGEHSDALTDARVVSLGRIALGLDANSGSVALWSQRLSLLRDLQRGQKGGDVAKERNRDLGSAALGLLAELRDPTPAGTVYARR